MTAASLGPHDWTHPAEHCDEPECGHITRRTCEGAEKLTKWLRETLQKRTEQLTEADPNWAVRAAENLVRAVFAERLDAADQDKRPVYFGLWYDPAESIPKSGVPVIALVINRLGNTRRIRACYAAPNTLELSPEAEDDGGTYDEEKDKYYCSEGWYEMNEYEDTHWKISDPVVAWTDLPELPEKYRKAER